LPDVRSAEARSAQIGGPDCIPHSFQVRANICEPFTASRARNLLAKRDCRFSEGDEITEDWPQVPFIGFTFALSCD
jgi:hypothetical protein